jgi:hypothetical protein
VGRPRPVTGDAELAGSPAGLVRGWKVSGLPTRPRPASLALDGANAPPGGPGAVVWGRPRPVAPSAHSPALLPLETRS